MLEDMILLLVGIGMGWFGAKFLGDINGNSM